jgi:hypothetical protein
MITCYLQGGLGNQLFQLFTTMSYSFQFETSFFFCNQYELTNNRHTYWNNFLSNLQPFLQSLSSIPSLITINEKSFEYNDITNKIKEQISNSIMLVGYFQSYKYFEKYKNYIFRLIKLQQSKDIIYNKYKQDYSNIISIHFRLGDYKILQEHYVILDENYYNNAISYILLTNKPKKVIYFYEKKDKNDVEIIINKLKTNFSQLEFTECNNNLEDYEEMLVMSLCKYNIIANSTFSWWGAYFNQNENKIICYPSKWFGTKLTFNNINDLFPDDWIEIFC